VTGTTPTWLFLSVVWGSTWLVIKLGLEDLPPLTFAALRFALALAPLLWLLARRGAPLPRSGRDWALLALTGFLVFSVDYGLIFWAEQHITSGLTAVLFTTLPLFGLVFAHYLVPAEPLRLRKLLGVLLGIGGVTLIFADQLRQDDPLAPVAALAVVLAAAAAALSNTVVKARLIHLAPLVVTTTQMAAGLLPLLLASLAWEGSPARIEWTPLGVGCLAYLAFVGSTLSFILWYRLIRVIEVTKAQLIPLLNTLVAVALGWLVLDETLGLRALAGSVSVLAGLALTLSAKAPPPPDESCEHC